MEILAAWLLADFIGGIVHWFEDLYLDGDSRFQFINRVSRDNDLHHSDPTALTRISFWENIDTTIQITIPLSVFFFIIGAPTFIWLAFFFLTFANIVHRYAHVAPWVTPFPIRCLQRTGIFISQDHHKEHHYGEDWGLLKKQDTTIRWCPMTNWVNPILDYINFFKYLGVLFWLVGINNTKERNNGKINK